ncbi:hypothetical protein BLNAU_16663 [Blattamonas nauphoetae]|uniref:Uncharacterized protein n=1 Tax=Blattamonas nauphoetae TaxID=2049346 RepID=A0ABQ9XAX3_9EUKA|nr:hypothetical protein BLNAU_16663 [Blattamonas nauphoetae]
MGDVYEWESLSNKYYQNPLDSYTFQDPLDSHAFQNPQDFPSYCSEPEEWPLTFEFTLGDPNPEQFSPHYNSPKPPFNDVHLSTNLSHETSFTSVPPYKDLLQSQSTHNVLSRIHHSSKVKASPKPIPVKFTLQALYPSDGNPLENFPYCDNFLSLQYARGRILIKLDCDCDGTRQSYQITIRPSLIALITLRGVDKGSDSFIQTELAKNRHRLYREPDQEPPVTILDETITSSQTDILIRYSSPPEVVMCIPSKDKSMRKSQPSFLPNLPRHSLDRNVVLRVGKCKQSCQPRVLQQLLKQFINDTWENDQQKLIAEKRKRR